MPVDVRPEDGISDIVAHFEAQLGAGDAPFALLVQFRTASDQARSVVEAFGRARPETLQEPGCRAFEIAADPADPQRFVVFESWRSLADLDAHLRLPHIVALRETVDNAAAEPPSFQVLATQAV